MIFHTPGALHEALDRDFEGQCRDLAELDFRHPKIRPYQRDANHAIEDALASRKRRMLVAMAVRGLLRSHAENRRIRASAS